MTVPTDPSPTSNRPARSRRRITPMVFVVGGVAALVLALTPTGALGAFTAAITNSDDTAGSGNLIMQESHTAGSTTTTCASTDGGGIGTNSATCSTINKYGGNLAMAPGQTVSTSVTLTNAGTIPATTFTLTPGSCTQSSNGTAGSATDLCAHLTVVITSGATTVYNGTAAAFSSAQNLAAPVAAGASVPFTFAVTLDSAVGNTYQGLQASQPLTWTFNS